MKERYTRAIARRLISRRLTFRGRSAVDDGQMTLLTVDWHTTADACRLIRSFRRFVSPSAPVVVVQNGEQSANRELRAAGARCVSARCNLHHGLGLDFGMRYVQTEYTLVCDPDSAIISPGFREQVLSRVKAVGACSIDNGATFYHPICLCFRTELWKKNLISMQEHWPEWDVAGQLTDHLGGLKIEGLLPRTRGLGRALPSARAGQTHYPAEVYADVFTNTYAMSRKVEQPDRPDFDGWSRSQIEDYHERWRQWVGDVVDKNGSVSSFPQ